MNIHHYSYKNRIKYTRRILSAIDLENKGALEVGCGDGYFLKNLNAEYKIGCDLSRTALKNAKINNRIEADAENLPFRDASFDVVISLELIEHLQKPQKAILEFMRVSNDKIVISTPNLDGYKTYNIFLIIISGISRAFLNFGNKSQDEVHTEDRFALLHRSTGHINILSASYLEEFFRRNNLKIRKEVFLRVFPFYDTIYYHIFNSKSRRDVKIRSIISAIDYYLIKVPQALKKYILHEGSQVIFFLEKEKKARK